MYNICNICKKLKIFSFHSVNCDNNYKSGLKFINFIIKKLSKNITANTNKIF